MLHKPGMVLPRRAKAVPLRRNDGRAVPFRRSRKSKRGWIQSAKDMWLLLLAAVVVPPAAMAAVHLWPAPHAAAGSESETASFSRCGATRESCVVDGDTFWYRGTKIRIADINTPEVNEPECPAEAELGARATERLAELLNDGPFTLERINRDTDRYGRLLRIVSRNGESLGDVLVSEGLAERWKGYRGSWC